MRTSFLVLVLFISGFSVSAFELLSGNQYKVNLVYENEPVDRYIDSIIYTAGFRVPVDFSLYGQFLPALLFSSEPYEYLAVKEMARPVEREFAEQMQILSFFIDFPVGASFPLGKSDLPPELGIFVGPSAFIRIPAYGPGSDYRQDFFSYFFGDYRYIYAHSMVVFEFPVSSKVGFTVNAETEWPLANTWLENDLGFWNEFAVNAFIGIRFY